MSGEERPGGRMDVSRQQRSGWPRRDRVALAALVALVLGSLPFLVHGFYDPVSDAGLYLLLSRSLAAGEGYRFLGEPFVLRPPGFAVLLAPFAESSFAARAPASATGFPSPSSSSCACSVFRRRSSS